MTKQYTFCLLLLLAILTGCGGDGNKNKSQRKEAEDMVYAAYLAQDYPRIIELADSFKALKADTTLFRDGAEQNDDLTMLALRVSSSHSKIINPEQIDQ